MLFFLVLLTFPLFAATQFNFGDNPDEKHKIFIKESQRLSRDLFKEYDPMVAPVYTGYNFSYEADEEPNQPPRFNISNLLYYIKLIEVDEPEEKVSFVMELVTYWYDARLVWNHENYSGVDSLYVTTDKIWVPPMQPFGPNDYVMFENGPGKICGVRYDGRMIGYVSIKVSSVCPMQVEDFPFDVQTCKIQMGLPYFSINEIKLYSEIYDKILNESVIATMGNSEWSVIGLTNRVDVSDYHDDFGSMEFAVYEVKIKRNPVYYIYMIIIPAFIINAVSIVGVFMLGADNMARLNVGLTNIMTMTFILGVMADKIPKTPAIPLLGIYIIVNLGIMVVSLCLMSGLTKFRMAIKRRQKASSKNYWKTMETFTTSVLLEYALIVVLESANGANFIAIMGRW